MDDKGVMMIKIGMIILCLSGLTYGMEDKNKEQMVQMYKRDILPHMPRFTQVTEENGIAMLGQLVQTNFDSKHSHWQFKHALAWAKENAQDADYQVDIAILKRYIAAIIDKAHANNNVQEVEKDIKENKESLRWVVMADVNSAVSDERIKDRWNKFMITVSESIPIDLNNT